MVGISRRHSIHCFCQSYINVSRKDGFWQPQLDIREMVTDIHTWLAQNRAALEPILK